ncbi:hypothetical protein [Archaeoglobus neptunius]|uniref:hypothetical protein n=1 Tax=Archaeoglobus neptunius TaxID=2798580 RepID=UPI0019260C0F|nr:hypothetical protein [Archaeoglobus neptunius]
MGIFRKEIPVWEKIVGVTLLAMIGVMGVCKAMVGKLMLPTTTKELLETIAMRAFIIWWIGVIVFAFYTIVRYRISKPAFSMYYTGIGILILAAAYLLKLQCSWLQSYCWAAFPALQI